jgi:arylsulfatase A-like enzyme
MPHSSHKHATPKRPNLIFIVADDLGYADLGCYGSREPTSPHLDAMAKAGIRFTQGYSNSSVCSPTRFALATGRYQYRLRGAAEEPLAANAVGDKILGLPAEHPTLASLLRDSGYRTALVGKWHLGFQPHFGPLKSGYQEHFGPSSGGVDYFTHNTRQGMHDLFHNDKEVHRDGYLTDLLTDHACDWIQHEQRDATNELQPFFLSLHYTAPHWPWETREDRAVSEQIRTQSGGNIGHLNGGSIHTYRKMIQQMDEGIGKLLAVLDEMDQTDNTLVVFTSDNGGERFSDNWPLVGGKMDLTEGGIRVPYIARWPARIPAKSTSAVPVLTMDWVSTMLDAAGASPHPDYPLDGASLLEHIQRPAQATVLAERALFWRMKYRGQRAVRQGAWKWLTVDEHEYLFNLEQDERERANRKNEENERLQSLKETFSAWEASMPAIPVEAKVSVLCTPEHMPRPS